MEIKREKEFSFPFPNDGNQKGKGILFSISEEDLVAARDKILKIIGK
jgi:hypothetical protein